ncbi:hypothetical protein [Polynucleobacter sinensis]|uniref:hypothetical protein n=1 Tax=Polynucleobacter sinensis TaxID=1743157 RepID=UPI000780E1C8|nr:hypothetical protein [Polynucleobacter sinensis]
MFQNKLLYFLTSNYAFPDRFYYPQGEQYGMPSRHISSQSFDDILSELGDDPAIPDPHGIRKSTAPQRPTPESQMKPKSPSLSMNNIKLAGLKMAPLFILGGVSILLNGALFLAFESHKEALKMETHRLQDELSGLKRELHKQQGDLDEKQEDLYDTLEELQVSIHSLSEKRPISTPRSQPLATPHEAELRSWRYLGLIKVNGVEQAFFHTGKATRMMAKNELVLGEWRLMDIQKELATLSHPRGKSLNFRSAKSE